MRFGPLPLAQVFLFHIKKLVSFLQFQRHVILVSCDAIAKELFYQNNTQVTIK